MSQQDDARQHQAETDPPYGVSLLGGQNAGRRCQGADMDGVSGRKSVEPVARERYSPPMSADREPVRPLLIEYGLEQVRQRGCDQRRQEHVVACEPGLLVLVARVEPPAGGQRAKDMFIRAPSQRFGRLFDAGPGMG